MSLPKEVEEFCKAVGRLAQEHEIADFDLSIKHHDHWGRVKAHWEKGSHNSQSNKMHIVTEEHTHTTLNGKDFYS